MKSPQRGAALLLAIIMTAAITAIAVAMIRLSSRELAGATSARQSAALSACAEAGRQLLMSQFRSLGVAPASLQLLDVTLDGTGGATRVVGGHVGESVQIKQVTVLPASTFGVSPNSVRDLSNIISGAATLGGTPYRIVVHCQSGGSAADPTTGQQLEVEFGMKFGM
jgi:hypothetical protein